MRVFGNAGCGGPLGNGTNGDRVSWSVAIFSSSAVFDLVDGAMFDVVYDTVCDVDARDLQSLDPMQEVIALEMVKELFLCPT